MIPTQSEIPLLLENVSLVFLDRSRLLFVWLVCPLTGPRVLGITVVHYCEILGWSALMFDVRIGTFHLTAVLCAHLPAGSRYCGLIATQSEIPLLLEHVLLVWWFFATPVFFDVFVFLQVPVFLVSQWCVCSKSLVGQRWCLTSCSVIFVWLQCDMRSSACWIATLWLDSHLIWDSSPFRARFFSVMVLCHPFSLTCLCSYRFPCSWYHSGVFVRNPWLVNVDVWHHVR